MFENIDLYYLWNCSITECRFIFKELSSIFETFIYSGIVAGIWSLLISVSYIEMSINEYAKEYQ